MFDLQGAYARSYPLGLPMAILKMYEFSALCTNKTRKLWKCYEKIMHELSLCVNKSVICPNGVLTSLRG